MACALTSSYTFLGCGGGAGGIKKVYITEAANVTAYTAAASVITAITMNGVTKFRVYALDKEMGSFSYNGTKTPGGALVYEPSVEFTINTLTTLMQAEIKLMAQNNLIMMVQDVNDVYWAFGFDRFMELISSTAESGHGMSDFNGNKLTFKGKETAAMQQVQTSVIATVI